MLISFVLSLVLSHHHHHLYNIHLKSFRMVRLKSSKERSLSSLCIQQRRRHQHLASVLFVCECEWEKEVLITITIPEIFFNFSSSSLLFLSHFELTTFDMFDDFNIKVLIIFFYFNFFYLSFFNVLCEIYQRWFFVLEKICM